LKNVLGIINTSTNAANKSAFKWNKPSTTEVVETQKDNFDSIVFKKKSLLEIQMEEKIVRDREEEELQQQLQRVAKEKSLESANKVFFFCFC
jgi:hypothetical protein